MRNLISDGSSIAHRGEVVATQRYQYLDEGVNDSKVLLLIGGEKVELAGPDDSLGAAPDAQLAIDAAGVSLDRVQRDDELVGNGLVGEPLADEVQDIELAWGEGVGEWLSVGVWECG